MLAERYHLTAAMEEQYYLLHKVYQLAAGLLFEECEVKVLSPVEAAVS